MGSNYIEDIDINKIEFDEITKYFKKGFVENLQIILFYCEQGIENKSAREKIEENYNELRDLYLNHIDFSKVNKELQKIMLPVKEDITELGNVLDEYYINGNSKSVNKIEEIIEKIAQDSRRYQKVFFEKLKEYKREGNDGFKINYKGEEFLY